MNTFWTIVGYIANVIAIVALWSNISSMCFNIRHFLRGALRITYQSGEYKIMVIDNTNRKTKLIYQSSTNEDDYVIYREIGKIEKHEIIPPFFKWKMSHWVDDIRTPEYPIRLLY